MSVIELTADFEVFDKRFRRLVFPNVHLEVRGELDDGHGRALLSPNAACRGRTPAASR